MNRELFNDFITILVAIDPIGTVPLLAAATHTLKEAERRRIVIRGVLIASCVLFGFAVFGQVLLKTLGISFSSFRISGGIILFLVGLQMVFQDHADSLKHMEKDSGKRDLAVFPIAFPYIAGPGSMLAIMVAMRNMTDSPVKFGLKIVTVLLVMLVTLVTLLSTTRLNRALGKTGSEVIGRVMGILLAALAAESVVRGVIEAMGWTPPG